MSNIKILLGRKLRKLRKARGLSQEQLALKAGLDRSFIGKVERGEKNISIENVERLAKTLKVSVEELFH